MAGVGFGCVGGYFNLMSDPPPSVGLAEWRSYFRLYRPNEDPDYPTLGMLLGTNVGGLWYWCLDQAIVQRVLSARSLPHARASTIFAGFLKITPVFLMVLTSHGLDPPASGLGGWLLRAAAAWPLLSPQWSVDRDRLCRSCPASSRAASLTPSSPPRAPTRRCPS